MIILSPIFHPAEELTIIWVLPTIAVCFNKDHADDGVEAYNYSPPVIANILFPLDLLSMTIFT